MKHTRKPNWNEQTVILKGLLFKLTFLNKKEVFMNVPSVSLCYALHADGTTLQYSRQDFSRKGTCCLYKSEPTPSSSLCSVHMNVPLCTKSSARGHPLQDAPSPAQSPMQRHYFPFAPVHLNKVFHSVLRERRQST